jgi:hypothetical protein
MVTIPSSSGTICAQGSALGIFLRLRTSSRSPALRIPVAVPALDHSLHSLREPAWDALPDSGDQA